MDRIEFERLTAAQLKYLDIVTEDTRFTGKLICDIHADWLGGVYEWAGRHRTVELEKGDFRWPPAHLVAANMSRFERDVLPRHTPCRGSTVRDVAHSVATVHADLLLIHPFREGNGRLARVIADLMAAQARLPLPLYRFTGRGSAVKRKLYLDAVKRGYLGDLDDLTSFFEESIALRLKTPAS